MKKLLTTLTVIALFIISLVGTTNAGSGACSGHDGVDCLAGHDTDGSVICKDGWTGSSVDYVNIYEVCKEDYLEPGPFYDVSQDNKNREAIIYLYEEEIIGGYPDNTFQSEKEINRAELIKILVEGVGITPEAADNNNCFTDVADEWYAPHICYAKSAGWIDGYPDGSFKPAQIVIKVEAIKMLLNIQDVSVADEVEEKPFADTPVEEWYTPYVSKAKELGILEESGRRFRPSYNMTRGGVSENLYRLLEHTENTN